MENASDRAVTQRNTAAAFGKYMIEEKKMRGQPSKLEDNSVPSVHNRDSEGNRLQVQCSRILKKVTGEKVTQAGRTAWKVQALAKGTTSIYLLPPFLFETCLLPLGVTTGLPEDWVLPSSLQLHL